MATKIKQKLLNDVGVSSGNQTGLTNTDKYRKDASFVGRVKTPRSASAKVSSSTLKNVAGTYNPTFPASAPWLRGNH